MQQKARRLINMMTLDEKISQMMNETPGIPRLGIKPYDWWNEGLHGVGRDGRATVFPQPIGMGATFNPALIRQIGDAIATEGRAKYNVAQRNNNYARYTGLTFWSPNINIFRDPRWGRGMEPRTRGRLRLGRLAIRRRELQWTAARDLPRKHRCTATLRGLCDERTHL